MPIEDLSSILQEHPFLHDLEPRHIQTLVSCASNQRFQTGEILCRQGEQADVFYLIRQGKVALGLHVPQSGVMRLETLGEGDILGWSWLVSPYLWHFDAQVVEPVRALVLDGKCLLNKSEQDHELGYQLLKRFASVMEQRVEAARLQLLDIYGKPKEVGARDRH